MRYLFARRPSGEFENYTASHIGAGTRYHQRFVEHPGRSLMWELEQEALREILVPLAPRRVLDFACGTGRISSFVERLLPDAAMTGIDISESMLQVARENAQRTDYRLMDSEQAIATFGAGHFDIVLAFRFFANAEQSLRERIAPDLATLLAPGGTLVVNNHRNFWSTSYVARRLLGQQPIGALDSDIEQLFTGRGLRVERRLSLGLWPQGDAKAMLLPWSAVKSIERWNLGSLASRHRLGYNTLWVLRKPAG